MNRAPTSPQPTRLPSGVIPGPTTRPTPHQPHHPGNPPPAQPRTHQPPAGTARELATLLREQGHTHLYTHAFAGQAVISLPQLTIWITARELTWTHNGQPTTWPAHDTHGAAHHITRIIQQPATQHTPRHACRP